MPYAIITVFDQTPFSNDTLLDAAGARPATPTPDRPSSTRWPRGRFPSRPIDLPDGISPSGRSMAEDEARFRSRRAENPHGGR